MPQQLKTLLQNLYPSASLAKTPSSSTYKKSILLRKQSSTLTPVVNRIKRKLHNVNDTDSGVDITSSNYLATVPTPANNYSAIPCECTRCQTRLAESVQLENTLKYAFVNYLREPTEQSFANIPVMVVKSFKPSTTKNSKQLDQLEVRKNNAINALFMKDNKWVYVKNSSNVKGFIPKKTLEPFYKRSCSTQRKNIKVSSQIVPAAPNSMPPTKPTKVSQRNLIDHTYMTINENDLKTNMVLEDMPTYETDLALLSVSTCTDSPKSKKSLKQNLIEKFTECDETPKISKASRDLIRILAQSKSRNRKISIAFRQLSNEATLTMLEQDVSKNYINLNDCKEKVSNKYENVSRRTEKRTLSKSKKYTIKYENLASFKSSAKRVKKSSEYSYTSSPSSIEYDTIAACGSELKSSSSCENYYTNEYLDSCEFTDESNHVYDHLSSNNSKVLNTYKVVEDYKADFKGDLSVRKGDIVYLIDQCASPGLSKVNNDYLNVRIYKRNSVINTTTSERVAEYQNVQGYIPRCHVTRV